MWIELHDDEKLDKTYMVNTDNICAIYQGQTGSGRRFTWVELANGGKISAYESMKEIRELIQKGADE